MRPQPPLAPSAELENAAVRELQRAWLHINASYFKGSLLPPLIELADTQRRLGAWYGNTRTIALTRSLVFGKSWGTVLEVLKHEVVHQYVHEVLGETDDTPHGAAFTRVCERMGIDARAAGTPLAPVDAVQGEAEAKVLQRVAKLLALAESPNVHEAEAAMSQAQKLLLKYNLEAAATPRPFSFRHLGEAKGRLFESERLVASILTKHFFVEAIWVHGFRANEGRSGRVLEICGTDQALDLAEYVHGFLQHTAERLWREHKRAHGLRLDSGRRVFLAGVMQGFSDKLRAQARENEQQGLVWVGDPELSRYYRRRHPHVRTTRSSGTPRDVNYVAGHNAGRQIVMHKVVTSHTSRPGGTRLLGGR